MAEVFYSSVLYELNSPFTIVKGLASICVFILGLFIRFVISNDLEVKAQTPEDTAQYSTQKNRKKMKLQYVPQHFFYPR